MTKPLLLGALLVLSLSCGHALSETNGNRATAEKDVDDPTKVTTKAGISFANNFDLDDSNFSLSGSWALGAARKINLRVNSDASEWRVGGSWLFSAGILNFNFGKNEFGNGASQTNYSIGTFVPLSLFDIKPFGIQIFPMAGYTYNDGNHLECGNNGSSKCALQGFDGEPSPENGFTNVNTAGSSVYLGAFALKPLSENFRLLGFMGGSYGSKNEVGEHYKGYFGGLGIGYSFTKQHSINAYTYIMDNNTYLDNADKRFSFSYTYQFN
jgi:hypothetical protein